MATYGVRLRNTTCGVKNVVQKGMTKEEAVTLRDSLKAIETDEVRVEAFIEMNQHERQVARLIQDAVSELIGGRENTMMDFPEDSEEYQMAKRDLNHDNLFEEVYDHVMALSRGNYASHIRFAGKEFIKERIESRLAKEGYGK